MKYGVLPATDKTFVAACMLLANDPAYASSRFAGVIGIRRMIHRGRSFGAIDGDRLVGFVAWHEVSTAMALDAIEKREMPKKLVPGGDAGSLLLAAFVAPSPSTALAFFRRFAAMHPGKILVGERHFENREARFFWVDRSGRMKGPDLQPLS